MGGLTQKPTFFLVLFSHHETASEFFMKLKSYGLVLSLLCDHIQGNTVEKDFQILIKLNFYQHLYHCKRKRLNKNMIKTFN